MVAKASPFSYWYTRGCLKVLEKLNGSFSSALKQPRDSLKQEGPLSRFSVLTEFRKGASRIDIWTPQSSQKLVGLAKSLFSSFTFSRSSKWEGLVKCSANYTPLSPISFLERAARVYRDRVSVIYGSLRYTWGETHERCLRLASSLTKIGISRGDVIAVLAFNIPAMYELHFGVPMAGGVLCTLNIRHSAKMVSALLRNSDAKVIFVDYQFLEIAREAIHLLTQQKANLPLLVLVSDCHDALPSVTNSIPNDVLEYESFLRSGQPEFQIRWPKDELEPISLNYTSGTTSTPKGVVYSHRGAYLNSLATVLMYEMNSMPVYLWTAPMFHCNGWCFAWGVAAQGGTSICLRNVIPKNIFEAISSHKVTHMCGVPTVLNMILNAAANDRKPLPRKVQVMTGGSPPSPNIILEMEELGFGITHIYGLTETYGPGTVCTWKPEWDLLPSEERVKLKSRQGLHHLGLAEVDIKDPVTMKSVPPDGKTMGEVMFRGNTVMSGYLNDLKATTEAFAGGWFRSGDLGVKDLDGYIKLKDRSKDIIISGGENVSSMEVESVICGHPAVLEAAVVGRPDDHWGETVCAFVKLKDGCEASAEDIIKFCRAHLANYMVPKAVYFEDLPKTSTGKTQKFVLREKAKTMGSPSKA
ncbi:butanoate--CoA ligase AAE1-like isoform X1 [Aristolochia californica]|uniref:butanoate--CoA ligase AAE1-like isoform X1 n=2 Tax=Aristolochia californica TaxID=171875 RepID=UPI0035D5C26E